jgi:hypothetical protein
MSDLYKRAIRLSTQFHPPNIDAYIPLYQSIYEGEHLDVRNGSSTSGFPYLLMLVLGICTALVVCLVATCAWLWYADQQDDAIVA